MQSQLDGDRIKRLGAPEQKVRIVGNLKFDLQPTGESLKLADLGFSPEVKVIIGGSTHPGEEELLLGIYKRLAPSFPEVRLVIAPRHVERAADIERIVTKGGYRPMRFSKRKEKVDSNTIIIIDTIGHLRALYDLAAIVFIGKTFRGIGGQNMIEPAFSGKVSIAGPHTENFKDVMSIFLRNEIIFEVPDEEALFDKVEYLLKNPTLVQTIGRKAKNVVAEYKGATHKTLQAVEDVLSAAIPI